MIRKIFFDFTFIFLKYQDFRDQQIIKKKDKTISSNLFYTKQTVQNACGTVALIHALANNKKTLDIQSKFRKILMKNKI